MRACDKVIQKTLELVERMAEIADEGDMVREDNGCGVLYGVLRDSAYKIRKLAETEKENHQRKGYWPKDIPLGAVEPGSNGHRESLMNQNTKGDEAMSRREVKGECPQCACGDVSFLGPEALKRKSIGDEKDVETLCPACGGVSGADAPERPDAK